MKRDVATIVDVSFVNSCAFGHMTKNVICDRASNRGHGRDELIAERGNGGLHAMRNRTAELTIRPSRSAQRGQLSHQLFENYRESLRGTLISCIPT